MIALLSLLCCNMLRFALAASEPQKVQFVPQDHARHTTKKLLWSIECRALHASLQLGLAPTPLMTACALVVSWPKLCINVLWGIALTQFLRKVNKHLAIGSASFKSVASEKLCSSDQIEPNHCAKAILQVAYHDSKTPISTSIAHRSHTIRQFCPSCFTISSTLVITIKFTADQQQRPTWAIL